MSGIQKGWIDSDIDTKNKNDKGTSDSGQYETFPKITTSVRDRKTEKVDLLRYEEEKKYINAGPRKQIENTVA